MLPISKSHRLLSFISVLTLLVVLQTNFSFALNVHTDYANGRILIKVETDDSRNCTLKKGITLLNLESQDGLLHETLVNLSFFQDANKVYVFCYKNNNLLDFESAEIKINLSEINQMLFKEKNRNLNQEISLEKDATVESVKLDKMNINTDILIILSILIFGLLALITISLLLLLRKHKNEVIKQHQNKKDSESKNQLIQQSEAKNINLLEALNQNKNSSNEELLSSAKPGLLQTTKQISEDDISKNKIDYSIFSEFEQDSKKKESEKKQTTKVETDIHEKNIFKQTLKILKNNDPKDVLFLISEIIEHGFIKDFIDYINSKNDVLIKNKLIDALYLLKEKSIITENKLNEFLRRLTQ